MYNSLYLLLVPNLFPLLAFTTVSDWARNAHRIVT